MSQAVYAQEPQYLTSTDPVSLALNDVLTNVVATVGATVAGLPGKVGVIPGDPEWDCEGTSDAEGNCVGGQLWVRLIRTFPTSNFPVPEVTFPRCPPPILALDIEVGILRCVPAVNDDGSAIDPFTLAATASVTIPDGDAVTRGVMCAINTWNKTHTLRRQGMFVEQIGLGPEGGCVGSSTRLYAGIDICSC